MTGSYEDNMVIPVILCGGSGTRLWPLSRTSYPKQFVDLGDGKTLFKETVRRAMSLGDGIGASIVVTSDSQRFYAQANLMECGHQAKILIEPVARNTAPAITAAAFCALKDNPEAVLLVMPSDHAIKDVGRFKGDVLKAVGLAKQGYLVTFGIQPNGPDTGFGYIKAGQSIAGECFNVDRFVEKPSEEKAVQMLSEGGFFWNSGIFVFRSDIFLEEVKALQPEIYDNVLLAIEQGTTHDCVQNLDEAYFQKAPSISIDYAVMEKTQRAAMVPSEIRWSDLGSWASFYQESQKDVDGNAFQGDVVSIDNKGCYINSRSRLVAAVGLRDISIVETRDAVLVAPIDKSQDVRRVVKELKRSNRREADIHPLVYRPWGSYESLTSGDRFQVKRLIVQPGQSLSLQKHYHRAEHWIIVQGSAEIALGEKILFLTENQSTYIPVGVVHRLKNPGRIPLVVIEVQSGSYLGEDDIVRLEDVYQRI